MSSYVTGTMSTTAYLLYKLYQYQDTLIDSCTTMTLLGGFFLLKYKLNPSTQQLAWVMTFLTSASASVFVLDYLLQLAGLDTSAFNKYNHDRLVTFLTALLIVYLFLDFTLGLTYHYYQRKFDLHCPWLHHAINSLVTIWAISGHFCPLPPSALIALELPTALLATSKVYPKYQNDKTFRVSFYTTRAFYLAVVLHSLYYRTLAMTLTSAIPVVLLHVAWVYIWGQRMGTKLHMS